MASAAAVRTPRVVESHRWFISFLFLTPDSIGSHTTSQPTTTHAGGPAPTAEQAVAAVCGVVWHDGGAGSGGLLPHVVCNESFSTQLMSKAKMEAVVLGEGVRPEHLWERSV